MQEKIESQDWALSTLYDEITFQKVKIKQPLKFDDCGNQVEAEQIMQET